MSVGRAAYVYDVAYKFTGKERDSETGNDYFEARFNSSTLGRFLSPDPLSGHQEDPQTLNKYVYVRDNPLILTDPTGLDFNLKCTQTADNNATCQDGVQGTILKNGKFQPTVVTSASLQDPHSGNTAKVNQNGVQITTASGTSEGVFIHGTTALNDIQGSGDLKGFTFDINDNGGGTASGMWHFSGTNEQAETALKAAGGWNKGLADALDSTEYGHHPFSDQFRFGCGPSSHLSVPWPVIPSDVPRMNPAYTTPASGDYHVDSSVGFEHDVRSYVPGVSCAP
jgi:RHS repeat-associated protein